MSSSLRVVILSDTHGELDDRIAREAAASDVVVHAGDVGNRGVLDALEPRGGKVVAVRGNNDVREKWSASEWDFLETLPWEARLDLPGGELVVVHGHGYGYPGRHHERMRRDYPQARLVVYGHSHLEVSDRSGLPWVLNPGAAGRVRTHGGPTYTLLLASESHWQMQTRRFPPPEKRRPRTKRTANL
ncbi:MAG: metallophosphoesterase family protein [Gammaproteobacteria bacterium]|nr:metallophosphoesterase family protein [Gammaproteobacteria bacterium]